MDGIRIRHLPDQCLEKVLKIYFSKPEHGGGRIEKIYFPLMNNDAVIIFEDRRVLQTITQYDHKMAGSDLKLEILPEHMIFSTIVAKVDTNASIILQVSQKLRDEMEFSENIKIIENEDQTYSLKGNWFQLEWAWNYLNCYMKHQEVIQSQIEQTSVPPQHHPVAMETDNNDDDKWKTYRVRSTSPTEVNSMLRQNIADRAKVEENLRSLKSPRQPVRGGRMETTPPRDEMSLGQGQISMGDYRTSSKDEAYSKSIGSPHESLRDTSSPHTSTRRSPSPHIQSVGTSPSRNEGASLTGLKDNINQSYGAGYSNASSMNRGHGRVNPDDYDTDDEIADIGRFRGQEHKVPFESVHSSLGISNQLRKSDENKTFAEFSSMPLSYSSQSHSHVSLHENTGLNTDKMQHRDQHDRLQIGMTTSKKSHLDSYVKDSALAGSLLSDPKDMSLYGATASSRTFNDTSSRTKLDVLKTGSSSGLSSSNLPDRYSEDQLQSQFYIKNIKVTVYFGDLLQETAEGIVNAANCDLDHMGGVAYAIAQARGPDMGRECRKYIRDHGNLSVSEVMHTSGGGDIKALHIIHAYGPMWLGEESKTRSANQLRDTFLNCFIYAERKLSLQSLSTPAISTGVFGVPLDVCVRSFLDAVLIFTDKYEDSGLTDIRLISNDAESTVTAIVLLQTLLDTGIDSLTTEALESYQKFTEKSKMNLPRGRPENTDFTRSYASPGRSSLTSSVSHHRRSSSTSRVSDRRRNEDVEQHRKFVFETETNAWAEKDMESSITKDRARPRTSSSSEAKRLAGMTTGRSSSGVEKPYQSSGLGKSSTSSRLGISLHSPSSGEQSRRGVPQIKPTLFSNKERLTTRKPSSTKSSRDQVKSRGSAVKGGDDFRSRVSPVSDSNDDTYPYKSAGRRYLGDKDDDFGLQSLPVNLGQHDSSYREKFLRLNSEDKPDKKVNLCAICLDKVTKPKVLSKCGHTFCTSCIDGYFAAAQPKCPTCGTLYGKIKGDQPKGGNMTYSTDRRLTIPGYEREDGAIIINYTFPGGIQEACHPNPGRSYKGLSRKAYLPNSIEGREVLRLLKKSFQANLTFTIGDSRTSGDAGVITWNDIHHKTNVTGGSTKFGYPDPTYLKRVKEELASKGIVS